MNGAERSTPCAASASLRSPCSAVAATRSRTGALVTFFEDRFPKPENLVAYVQRLNGVARLRPDSKIVLDRAWGDPQARLNGVLQLSKGLAKAAG